MCGLVGFFGRSTTKTDEVFSDMLQVDVIRGADSTGAAFIRNDKDANVVLVKDTLLPQHLISLPDYKRGMNSFNLAILGHNRAATRGSLSTENAHPFHHDHIVGTHNGTLVRWDDFDDKAKFETDSECIFYNINKNGIEWVWSRLQGAAALAYFNGSEYSINLITNGERPLSFLRLKDKSGIFWSSESWMARACANRRQVEVTESVVLKEHHLFTLTMKGNQVVETSRRLDPFVPIVSPIGAAGGTTIWNHTHDHYQGPTKQEIQRWTRNASREGSSIPNSSSRVNTSVDRKPLSSTELTGKAKETRKEKARAEKLLRQGMIKVFNGDYITRHMWDQRYGKCAFCAQPLDPSDTSIEYLDYSLAGCQDCNDQADKFNISPRGVV